MSENVCESSTLFSEIEVNLSQFNDASDVQLAESPLNSSSQLWHFPPLEYVNKFSDGLSCENGIISPDNISLDNSIAQVDAELLLDPSFTQFQQSLVESVDIDTFSALQTNSHLYVENIKFETQSKPIEQPAHDFKTNFLSSPLVRTKSASQVIKTEPETAIVTRGRSATWPLTPHSPQEIIGQIISQQSNGNEYLDIAPYVIFPQHEAAKRLNIPSSTLSKKWKDATVNRKWPYRTLCKIDKDISTIMHNVHRNRNGVIDKVTEQQLAVLLQQRQAESRSVVVRMN